MRMINLCESVKTGLSINLHDFYVDQHFLHCNVWKLMISYIISLPEEVSPSATASLKYTRRPRLSSSSSHAPSSISSPVSSMHVLLVCFDGC